MSFTRPLAKQLAPRDMRVNAMAPGPIVTALQLASRDPEDTEGFGVGTPMHRRAAQPAELGPPFVFLAGPDSNVTTGACMHVNSKLSQIKFVMIESGFFALYFGLQKHSMFLSDCNVI